MSRMLLFVFCLQLVPLSAGAQSESPTLDRIAETGEFRIGFVPDAPPMSFLDASGNAVGYSIDLCRQIASSIRNDLGLEKLEISFTPLVSMEERLSGVQDGLVDIECGATTVTLSRRERVDFTLMTFITGGAVVSRRARAINTLDDIGGKNIAVIGGTTTEDALRKFIQLNEIKTRLTMIRTHDEGMELLNGKKVDGYASDRAMLIGQVFRTADANQFALTQSVFSFEPYSMMVRRGDTQFRLAADRALASLYRTARIRRLYQNWFGRYGEPLSPIVQAMYEFQAVGE